MVALKHKEYDLLALYDRICLVAHFEQTFNNFCIPADERQYHVQCMHYIPSHLIVYICNYVGMAMSACIFSLICI